MSLTRVDVPPTEAELIRALEKNSVGRNGEVADFLNTLGEIEGPFSIFVDSAWGDGKTFFVKQVELILRLQNPQLEDGIDSESFKIWDGIKEIFPDTDRYFPIYFNAWENDDFDDPLLPLLATVAEYCRFTNIEDRVDSRKAIAGIIEVIAGAGSLMLAAAGAPAGAEVLGEGVAKTAEALNGESMLDAFAKRVEFREEFDLIAEASLREIACKIVLFIDELDRCRPRFAVKLLEQTKALFNQGNVIVVYSTESTQLAHAIRGLYGNRFDAEKYLERFFDLKKTLNPVRSVEYLRYLGFNDRDSYNYTEVANGFIRLLQPTMREANRMVESLRRGQRFVQSDQRDGAISGTAFLFANGVLLPTLIVMSFDKPELWRDVLRRRNFNCVYEYGKRNDKFIEIMDEISSRSQSDRGRIEPTDAARAEFIEAICAYIFVDDCMDPQFRRASDFVERGFLGRINKEAIRTLAAGY